MSNQENMNGSMVKPADTSVLRTDDFGHGGSNPSGPTTPYHQWADYQDSEAEKKVEVGQHRFFAIDGIGMMEGTITRLDQNTCWMKEDGNDFEWEIPWNISGMSGVGILINGAEHQKIMRDVDVESVQQG